ncbi:MAG: deoxyribonucleotide triphosphate pyrophosphatase [Nodularia sp. (in: Bacteria)]|nr:MAG: deoxyribonucleotide triphosphate pyrophosphatase [Nodularia sp. (in: cyanobacteria)]
MKPLANVALALLCGTISIAALNPMSGAIAQEAEISPPSGTSINQQIDIQGEVDIEIENEIEIELEPEQSIIYTPQPMEENDLD